MTQLTREQVLVLLRTGTPEERVAFLQSLPPNGFKDAAVALMSSGNPGMVVVALGLLIQEYCYGSNPEWGAVLAAAAHERAVEIWETVPSHGLLPTTLSGLASSHVRALTLLGRSKEVLDATDRYIRLYERLGEQENLPSLKVLRIEALVNLKRLYDADVELQDEALLQHPIVGIEARRLKGWVDRYRGDPTALKSERESAPAPPMGLRVEGEAGEELPMLVDQQLLDRERENTERVGGEQERQRLAKLSESGSGGPGGALLEGDELGLDAAPTHAPPTSAPALAPPEVRWLNAGIRDHDREKPLRVKEPYVLEFGVDIKQEGDASAPVPASALLFTPGEELIELTVQLQSGDFDVAQDSQILKLPRIGSSKGKARFDVVPLHEGRGTLTATVHKQGNFVMQMEIAYSVGTAATEPPSTITHGRTIAAAMNLQPRDLGMAITPAPGGGYECIVWGAVSTRVVLPISETELGDAIKTARDGLMSVVSQQDGASRRVFQTSLDIDAASQKQALRTLARAGATLFQRIFFGPAAGSDVRRVGEWLRKRAINAKERLKLQVVAQRFPIPWGLLYVGEAGEGTQLDWDLFLGMRHIIEQIPLQTDLRVDDFVIKSNCPSLAVSVNVNSGIDQQMKIDVVARQIRFWEATAATLGTRMRFAQRDSRADFLAALVNDSNDQLMYLYCHAVTSGPGDAGGINGSYLVLTNDERLTLGELNLDAPMKKPLQGNPLVFINACESAELTPSFYDGFVPYFMAKGARGVIGTECKTPALFATEWALRFFPRFLSGDPLGELFLDLRREFCTIHNNPLGLLYAVHCDGDTQIQPGLNV